jgi:hypothetical protein
VRIINPDLNVKQNSVEIKAPRQIQNKDSIQSPRAVVGLPGAGNEKESKQSREVSFRVV